MVRRILLISHLGPLFVSDYLYTYLTREKVEVYTVGRIYEHQPELERFHLKRCMENHFPVLWDGRYGENGATKFQIDMYSIFNIIGDAFDAIIECETANLEITDEFKLVEKKGVPYYYYKTELFNNYYNPIATHILYAGYPIKEKLERNTVLDGNQIPMIYFPFSFNPERNFTSIFPTNRLIFFGGVPQEHSLEVFKEGYKTRREVINYFKENLKEQFHCVEYTGTRPHTREGYLMTIVEYTMNLNVGIGCFNFRDFETIGISRCLVAYDHPEYRINGFVNGKNCILFKDNLCNAVHRIKKLLDHPEEIKKISAAGHKLFLEKHHPKIRVKQLLNVIYDE